MEPVEGENFVQKTEDKYAFIRLFLALFVAAIIIIDQSNLSNENVKMLFSLNENCAKSLFEFIFVTK